MRAHQLDAGGVILNTIEVDSLDFMAGLVDASIGGSIGDSIVGGVIIPAPLPSADVRRAAIQEDIDGLERNSLENRGAREIHLRLMEREAIDIAAAHPPATQAQVLATVPYYIKLKALDDEIGALRTAMAAI